VDDAGGGVVGLVTGGFFFPHAAAVIRTIARIAAVRFISILTSFDRSIGRCSID
jgi:hypothetical protein